MQDTQEVLFDFVAECVAKFIKDQNINETLPLGFTFSFPVENSTINSGKLVRWTKCFDAKGAVGKDPVQLLKDAFGRKGVSVINTKSFDGLQPLFVSQSELTIVIPFSIF